MEKSSKKRFWIDLGPLSKFMAYTNLAACPAIPLYLDIPFTGLGDFNALNGRWVNGSPLTFGGRATIRAHQPILCFPMTLPTRWVGRK